MFTRFSVKNFKNVEAQDLPLKRVNVLIGPNNSGKSNFLDAIRFWFTLQQTDPEGASRLVRALESLGGASVLKRGLAWPGVVSWSWSFELSSKAERRAGQRGFAVQIPDPVRFSVGVLVEKEELQVAGWGTRVRSGLSNEVSFTPENPAESATSVVTRLAPNELMVRVLGYDARLSPPDLADLPNWSLGFSELLRAKLGGPVLAADAETFGADGDGFANALRHLDRATVDGLEALAEPLRQAIPDLRRLVVNEGGGHRWVEVALRGEKAPIPLRTFSDGTVKLIVLAWALFGPKLGMLFLDEPELNQHPAWLRLIGRWIQTSPAVQQIFLTTHSPDLLDTFTEGFRAGEVGVLVFNLNPEGPTVKALELEAVDSLLKEGWELGDLYRVGDPQLGGWPF